VRQGSVLSPILFALCIDDIGKSCFVNCGHNIILYADDIILIASSVTELEKMLHMFENELRYIDMSGMEACPLKKRDINSLDFVVNRLFMKLLKTLDINIVRTCQHMFDFELPSVLLDRRTKKI